MDRMSTPSLWLYFRQGNQGSIKIKSINYFFLGRLLSNIFVEIEEFALFGNRWTFFMCVISVLMEFSYIIVKTFKYFLVSWVSTCCKLNKSSDSEILRQILMLYWDRGCVSHVIISSHIGGDWELLVEIWTTFISNVTTLFITPHNFIFPLSPIIVKNLSGKRISFDGDGVVLNNFSEWKCLQFDNLNEGQSEYQTFHLSLYVYSHIYSWNFTNLVFI